MRSVKSRDTTPELRVRRLLHAMGFRFRLHDKALPGTPDIVLKRHGKVIFVNGCFWHGHSCSKGRLPKTNIEFWKAKIEGNVLRDEAVRSRLAKLGWRCLTVWQCQTGSAAVLSRRLTSFLGANRGTHS